MKKIMIIFSICALACAALAGCSGNSESSSSAISATSQPQEISSAADSTDDEPVEIEETEAPAETEPQDAATAVAGDYSSYVGTWKETLDNGASHSVIINSVDGDSVSFTVNTVYPNAAHLVGSNDISGMIADGCVDFEYTDTFKNTGYGTLTFYDGYVHVTVTSNFDGSLAYLNFDSDLTEHTDYTGPAFD